MTIRLASLSPSKNQDGVPVTSNISLVIESDNTELNIQTVRFFINGLRIQASSRYSLETLSAQDKRSVEVTFYARRRIKFANERYGAPDTRYGKQDVLISNFMYGSRYSCKIEIDDFDGNTFSDFFSFTTEEGVFYNPSPDRYFYSPLSQYLANFLPEWSRARYDQFSVFQQVVNPAASFLEQIDKKIQTDFLNMFVQTANYNELANFYKVELGSNLVFNTKILDDGSSLQTPPNISALINITKVYPTAEFKNDLKSVFYEKLPTRLEASNIKIENEIIPVRQACRNRRVVDKKLDRDGTVSLNIYDGEQFVRRNVAAQQLEVLTVRITGLSPQAVEQVEDIVVYENSSYITQKKWSYIKDIQLINIQDDCTVRYGLSCLPPADAKTTDLFRHFSFDKLERESIWSLSENNFGTILSQEVYTEQDIEEIVNSKGAKTAVNEYQLLDLYGDSSISAISMCVDPFSDIIYVIDENFLYLYNKKEPYCSVIKLLKKSKTEPDIVLNCDTDNLARSEQGKFVSLSLSHKIIDREPASYAISIRYPNGTEYYINPLGDLKNNKSDAKTELKRGTLVVEANSIDIELPELGDYILSLEVQYRDGTSSLDQKIVRCLFKKPMAKYKLGRILNQSKPINIKRDFDGFIKILDEEGFLSQIHFAKDSMLIDYEKSVIYFNEKYEEVYLDD